MMRFPPTLFLLFVFGVRALAQAPHPLDSKPTGTGLTAYYWKLAPKTIPTSGDPMHRDGWADENVFSAPSTGQFVATTFAYSGNDLTPIQEWLGLDANGFSGKSDNLDDGCFRMVGYVRIETPGERTFTTTSDDGSVVYVNDELVVSNDNGHGNQTVSGSIDFPKPGFYPVDVRYFNGDWTNDAGSHGGANFMGEDGFEDLVPGLEGIAPFYESPVEDISGGEVAPWAPLAHYAMDEAADETRMRDVSGRGHHGAYEKVTLDRDPLATGRSAVFAEGAQGLVRRLPLRHFTLSMWLQASDPSGLQTLMGQGENTPVFALVLSGGNLAWFVEESIDVQTTNTPIQAEATYHVAATYSGRGQTPETILYINGAEVARKTGSTRIEPDSMEPLTIGAFSGNLPFDGRLDDVQIYDRVLSGDAIKGLYDEPGRVSDEILMGELPPGAIAGGLALGGTPGLAGYYWSLNPKEVPTSGEPLHRPGDGPDGIEGASSGWADEQVFNTLNSGSFVARTFHYEGNDLTTIENWLDADSRSYTGERGGLLGDGVIRMVGYLHVELPGERTFTTTSDDGSVVYISDELVVSNDNGHGNQEVSGTFDFPAAGFYPVDIRYFNGDWTNDAGDHGGANFLGQAGLEMGDFFVAVQDVEPFYIPPGGAFPTGDPQAGPGGNNEVPNEAIPGGLELAGAPGLAGFYWSLDPKAIPTSGEPMHRLGDGPNGLPGTNSGWVDRTVFTTPAAGSFSASSLDYGGNDLTPIREWLRSDQDSYAGTGGILGDAVIRMAGYVYIDAPGERSFTTTSDDGSVVYVNDQLVVSNDNGHGNQTVTGSIEFPSAGYYPIDVRYFNGDWTNDAGDHGGANFLAEAGFEDLVSTVEGVEPFFLANQNGGEVPQITQIVRTSEGVALQFPEGTDYDLEYSQDLVNWEVIARGINGIYLDPDPSRARGQAAYYRGVVP